MPSNLQRLLPSKPRVLKLEDPGSAPGHVCLSFVTLDKSVNFSELHSPQVLYEVGILCSQCVGY